MPVRATHPTTGNNDRVQPRQGCHSGRRRRRCKLARSSRNDLRDGAGVVSRDHARMDRSSASALRNSEPRGPSSKSVSGRAFETSLLPRKSRRTRYMNRGRVVTDPASARMRRGLFISRARPRATNLGGDRVGAILQSYCSSATAGTLPVVPGDAPTSSSKPVRSQSIVQPHLEALEAEGDHKIVNDQSRSTSLELGRW